MVEAYIKLSPSDVSKIDFRNIFYFDNHYLRLLQIENYRLGTNDTYKCKFLKIRYKDVPHTSNFTIETPETFGGSQIVLDNGAIVDPALIELLNWLSAWSNSYTVLPPLGF